ncbi:SMI1/KNR4 family protein [Bradyrhizobium liaoningense]|uniref:SMI1/KNR4 family protein n=1 Tax=Bradyrhizobium liaoningense TaxID=43992 RepID=UPI001BA5FDB7|nr:SMI1/KNR4 family protein [Bradyrhizobium liaoningense]MBR0986410.1 SMI1/KNR4 family protein [Bradyrhizobium liaoningense]
MSAGVIRTILQDFQGEIEHGPGATAEEIADCERELGVRFAGSFADYLQTFGWLSVGANEIYGLGAKIQSWRQLKEMTLSERTEMYPPLPPYLVAFYNDGFGNHACLDTRDIVDDEQSIVFWNHEAGPDQHLQPIANCFADWLHQLIVAEQRSG